MRLKYVCSSYSTALTQGEISDDGPFVVYGATGVVGYLSDYVASEEYLSIIKDGAGVGRVAHCDPKTSLLGTMAYIIPNEKADINWLKYVLISLDLGKSISKTTIPHIYFSDYGNREIPYVDRVTQQKIANFLDFQCSKIDSVADRTRASIEEYKKLKQATVDQAVTHGIVPKRKLKHSGLKWVEKIPEDWETINPKALFLQRKDKATAGEKQLTASQRYGVIYQDEYMELTGSRIVVVEKDFNILKHVEAGDFVISMRSFQGGLEYSTRTGSISSAYVMLIPNTELVYPRFFRWLLKSSVYINALQSTSNLVRDGQAMRYSNFAQVRLYTLPLKEQEEIADYLDRTCSEIDELIAKKERYLVELENYKKSLIYEYVTGKKEAPGHVD